MFLSNFFCSLFKGFLVGRRRLPHSVVRASFYRILYLVEGLELSKCYKNIIQFLMMRILKMLFGESFFKQNKTKQN